MELSHLLLRYGVRFNVLMTISVSIMNRRGNGPVSYACIVSTE